jgi:hypothetical protein
MARGVTAVKRSERGLAGSGWLGCCKCCCRIWLAMSWSSGGGGGCGSQIKRRTFVWRRGTRSRGLNASVNLIEVQRNYICRRYEEWHRVLEKQP